MLIFSQRILLTYLTPDGPILFPTLCQDMYLATVLEVLAFVPWQGGQYLQFIYGYHLPKLCFT